MSYFNVTSYNDAGSALTLGGEWTSRDRTEANKYKSVLYNHVKQKRRQNKLKSENDRPKSTPGLLFAEADNIVLPHTPPPKSAPPGSRPRCSGCDRFFDVDQLDGRKSLSPHLKIRKSPRKYSPDDGQAVREYSLGSGMTMAKSKNKVAVTIDTGLLMSMPAKPEVPPQSPDFRSSSTDNEALITLLQQQVSDLSLFFGEERLNHRDTIERAAAVMKERLRELDEKHLERLHQMQEDYEDKMDVMKQIHAEEMEHQETALDMQIARMKGELEFLQGAFDAYKKAPVQDMEEKWSKKEQDLGHKLQDDMESALRQQKMQMIEERNLDQNSMRLEFQKQMHDMAKGHEKEMEGMMKKLSTASSEVENLRGALDQLKAVRDELDHTVEKLALTEEILQDTRRDLQEANLTVLDFQDNFQNRVNEVDAKYQAKMDRLMQHNIELRKRYIGKCDELFNEKSNTEYKRVEKIASTKEMLQMIVHTKNRSNVSMASGVENTNSTRHKLIRSMSAPNTKKECRAAFQNAGNTESQGHVGITKSSRPQTSSPGHRKLNRESLHEKSFRALKESSQHPL